MLRLSIENGGIFCDIVDTLLTVGSGLEKKQHTCGLFWVEIYEANQNRIVLGLFAVQKWFGDPFILFIFSL